MKRRHQLRAALVVSVLAGLAACHPTIALPTNDASPLPSVSPLTPSESVADSTPEVLVPPTPVPGKATMTGAIATGGTDQSPLVNTVVWLGRVFWDGQKENAAFAIEASSGPSTISDSNGRFVFSGIEPGDYVIVVGDLEGSYAVVTEPDDPNTAVVFSVPPETVYDTGQLSVTLPD